MINIEHDRKEFSCGLAKKGGGKRGKERRELDREVQLAGKQTARVHAKKENWVEE